MKGHPATTFLGWAIRRAFAGLTCFCLLLQLEPVLAEPGADVDAQVKGAIETLLSGDMIDSVEASMKLGHLGKPAVSSLIALLKEPGFRAKFLVASALGDMGADAEPAVPNLIGLLTDSDPEVRMEAAEALGKIKAHANIAVPAFARIGLRSRGLSALGCSDGAPALRGRGRRGGAGLGWNAGRTEERFQHDASHDNPIAWRRQKAREGEFARDHRGRGGRQRRRGR